MNEQDAASMDLTRYTAEGGSVGVLLIHGYSSATPEVRPLGEALAKEGYTIVAPLLPGHGTSADDLMHRTWREMAKCVSTEYRALRSRCEKVFVAGVSMGGLLALYLAQENHDVDGVIAMAPALYISDPLHILLPLAGKLPYSLPKSQDIHTCVEDASCGPLVWSYDSNPLPFGLQLVKLMRHVRRRLGKVTAPILAIHGTEDRAVPVKASQKALSLSASTDQKLVLLPNSGHCLTVDGERELLHDECLDWIARYV